MQNSPSSQTLSALQYVLGALAVGLSGGLGALLTWLSSRTKVKPEIDAIHATADSTRATAEKVRAEARHLDSDTIIRAYERIDDLQEIIEELRVGLARLRAVDEENRILTGWNRRMKAALTAKGIPVPDKWVSGEF